MSSNLVVSESELKQCELELWEHVIFDSDCKRVYKDESEFALRLTNGNDAFKWFSMDTPEEDVTMMPVSIWDTIGSMTSKPINMRLVARA